MKAEAEKTLAAVNDKLARIKAAEHEDTSAKSSRLLMNYGRQTLDGNDVASEIQYFNRALIL
jgi:predicted ATPase